MCQLLPLPGPDWTPIPMIGLGFVLVLWTTVFGGTLLWDLSHGRVDPNTKSRYVWTYLSALFVGFLGWTIVFGAFAWNNAIIDWNETNLDRLFAHRCGIQQLTSTYNTAFHMVLILVIGGVVIEAIGGSFLNWTRRHLQRTVGGSSA